MEMVNFAKLRSQKETQVISPDDVGTLPVPKQYVEGTNLPTYLQRQAGNLRGFEEVGKDDLLIPRLSIAQGLSWQLTKTRPEYIPGLEQGQFFNSVTREVYGERVDLVPLFYFRQFIEFVPREQGGGVVTMYRSVDDVPAADLVFGSGEKGKGTKVTEFKSYMALRLGPHELVEPIVVSFKSTGMKMARQWNSQMRLLKLPMYCRAYALEVISVTNAQGSWYAAKVTPGSFLPEEFFQRAEKYFDELHGAGVQVDTAGMQEEERQGGGTDEGQPPF